MANSDSIYDLYNDKLTVDSSIVSTCVSAIKAQITSTTATEQTNTFDFDLTPYIGSLEEEQQIRIKNSIIYYLRNIGFRSYIAYNQANTPNVSSSYSLPLALNFNSEYVTNTMIIRIEWIIRKDTEFMKSYV